MTIVNKISYKTVSKAELGLSKSHMTHIGFAENTFDDWKKRISIKTKLNIFFDKNNKTTIETFLFNDPIKHPTQGLRSPKFRSGSDEELPSLRDSIIYFYKINMKNSVGTPLLILFDLKKSQYKLEAFLISPSHNIFKQLISSLSHPLITRNNSGEIYSKLITSTNNYSKDFKIISHIYKDNLSNKDSLEENDSVLIIDDLIATGGTAEAAAKLIEISNGKVAAFIFVINLFDLGGSDNLVKKGYTVENLMEFPGH